MWVFGAGTFQPFISASRIYPTPISYGCGPGHSEDTLVLYRKLELQPLALVVGVDVHSDRIGQKAEIFVGDALQCVFRGVVVKQPINVRPRAEPWCIAFHTNRAWPPAGRP